MEPLLVTCDKSVLFVGFAVEDTILRVPSYPNEDEIIQISSIYRQRGGDASNSAVVYSLLQQIEDVNMNHDMHRIYYMGALSTKENSSFILNDLKKYTNIDYNLCYFNNYNNVATSYIFISNKNGSRTIAHQPYIYPLTFHQFKDQINNKLNLSSMFNLIFFELSNEMCLMIEYIKNKYGQKIKVAVEIETVSVFYNKGYKEAKIQNIINNAILHSDIIFLSEQYLTEIGCNDAPHFLKEVMTKYRDHAKDKIFVIPVGALGAYCAQLSNHKHEVIFCASYAPPNNKVVDTLGAGDTFNASFLFGFRQGWNIKKCCNFANRIAGYKVGFRGFDSIQNFNLNSYPLQPNAKVQRIKAKM